MVDEGFLIIDEGSGSVKTFFVSPEGVLLRKAENRWDRENWTAKKAWPLILDAIRRLRLDSDVFVHGVCVTSMREEFILIDSEGNELEYSISKKSLRYGEEIVAKHGQHMYDKSGHWPVPNWMAGAILPYLNEFKPDLLEQTASILMLSDWLNYKLTGKACTEGTSACETGLYDVKANQFNWEIIDKLDLPPSIFPEIVENSTRIGEINEKTARKTSLRKGTPVFMGGADTQCGLLGMNTKIGEIAAVGGTTTPVQMVTSKPLFDPKRRTWTNNHLLKGTWIIESNAGYTGSAVHWARKEYGFTDYSQFDREASSSPIGSDGVLAYLGSHVFDSGPPYWSSDRLGDLPVKQKVVGGEDCDRAIVARAIIESNSYAVKANLDQILEITGSSVDSIKFCGGNSRSRLWMQMQADVLGLPVYVPDVNDGTAVGAAILAAAGSGYYSSIGQAAQEMIRFNEPYLPEEERHKVYAGHYLNWMNTRVEFAEYG